MFLESLVQENNENERSLVLLLGICRIITGHKGPEIEYPPFEIMLMFIN